MGKLLLEDQAPTITTVSDRASELRPADTDPMPLPLDQAQQDQVLLVEDLDPHELYALDSHSVSLHPHRPRSKTSVEDES
jgi:hypothetical protein